MQTLAVAGILAAFALACGLIWVVGRSLQRKGRDLNIVFPRYPDSLQAVEPKLGMPPRGLYPQDDTSVFVDDDPPTRGPFGADEAGH